MQKNVTGTNSYWHQQKNNLKDTISQKGTPTIFWTLSCAEFHWPEFHQMFFREGELQKQDTLRSNIVKNPHILDWFFTERVESFVSHWLYKILGAYWHWFRYEFAVLRGAVHVHGLAKLNSDPGLCDLAKIAVKGFEAQEKIANAPSMSSVEITQCESDIEDGEEAEKLLCSYSDTLLTATNPIDSDMFVRPSLHPCKQKFSKIVDFDQDYVELVNTVQRHSKCNSGYCLRHDKEGNQYCRFKYPLDHCSATFMQYDKIETRDGGVIIRSKLVLKRNDTRINRHQRIQLQGWRANCDIQNNIRSSCLH